MSDSSRTIRVKFDGDAKDLERASRAAKSAVDRVGKDSGKSFTSSFRRWLTGAGAGDMLKSGQFGASVFGSGFLGALKTPVIGPAIAAILLAAVGTVMPAVGAVAAGGLVLGFGAGLAALGLVFAAKSDEVGRVWSQTMSDLGADMELLATPFRQTLIDIAGYFRRTVDAFNPVLARAFASMAGPISDFADQFGKALEELVPAVGPLTDAFNAVLGALGPALQQALGTTSAGLIDLAHSVSENPEALADFVRGIGDLIGAALGLVTTLNDVNSTFSDITGGLSLVDVAIGGINASIAGLTGVFAGFNAVLGAADSLLHGANEDIVRNGQSMNEAADRVTRNAQAYAQTGGAAQHASGPVKTLEQRTNEAKKAAADAKQKFEDWISSMFRLANQALALSGAQISLRSAIANATASVRENGRTLDLNTEKGRANRTALNSVASAANAQTEAMLRSGRGAGAAATAAGKSRSAFSLLAQKMGLSKAQADALARSLIAIPNVSRTVTVTTRKITVNGVRQDQGIGDGGHTPTERRAVGGSTLPGRTYLVGERGPELLTMGNRGGHVTPNHQLGGGGNVEVRVFIGDTELRGIVRTEVKSSNRAVRRSVGAGARRGAPQ